MKSVTSHAEVEKALLARFNRQAVAAILEQRAKAPEPKIECDNEYCYCHLEKNGGHPQEMKA